MIRLEQLSYRYSGMEADVLANVDLDIAGGEMVLVTGSSGAGKSTLLRLMNGLVPHFHGGSLGGRVVVDGISTLDVLPRDLAGRVGFVGQDPENHSVVDRVEDDIAFTLENLGLEHKTMRKRVEEVLDALSIAHLRARSLDTLSGGERQRVAIAGALVAMPRYIVLDEPTSQLDPQSSEEVISAILRLRDEIGVGIILAEHRLERVIQYADKMCAVSGQKVISGDVRGLCESLGIGPPIARLGKALGWVPLPLTLREARHFAARLWPEHTSGAEKTTFGEEILRVAGLSLSLGGTKVLSNIDLTGVQGEVIAIMGRNGSGKTSLLRGISGLVPKTGGRVDSPAALAYVPQNPEAILFRATVADEIRATLKGRFLVADDRAVAAEAERFGVEAILERYPRDLSGGQRTKAALAAAASGGPEIILLDEPTRGMDEVSKDHLSALLSVWRQEGKLVLLATHDVELAARVATRVVLLSEGEVVLDAPPQTALAASITFSTQMNKVFGDPRILTLDDAIAALAEKVS